MSAGQIIATIIMVAMFEATLYLATSFIMWDLAWVTAAGPFVWMLRLLFACIAIMGGAIIAAASVDTAMKARPSPTSEE